MVLCSCTKNKTIVALVIPYSPSVSMQLNSGAASQGMWVMRNTMCHRVLPEVIRMRSSQVRSTQADAHRWWESCLDKPACWPHFSFS